MFRNILQKHNKSLCYALLTFIIATNIIYLPSAKANEYIPGGLTAPNINLFKDLPTGEINTSFQPEQKNPTKDVSFRRCLTDNICSIGEFFSNVWNKGQDIIYKIVNPNPDLNLTPGIQFGQVPILNNDGVVIWNIALPANIPTGTPASPYNIYSCTVYANTTGNLTYYEPSCTGLNYSQVPTLPIYNQASQYPGYLHAYPSSPGGTTVLKGVLIKACFELCIVVDSKPAPNQPPLPPQYNPEPQTPTQPQAEPSRRLKYTVHCRDINTGTITQTIKYSAPYLHSQGYTAPIKIECPTGKRVTATNIYEEKNINNNWVVSNVTNNNQGDINNNNTGNITNIYYPETVISNTNIDKNCIIGIDNCKPDILKGSNNGAVSCFNNVPNCQDFQSEVVNKIQNNTYNQQTSQYACIYNGRIVDMQQCKTIFNVITNNQNNIYNNTPANTKTLEDAKECSPGGLSVLNPYSYVVATTCLFELLFVPSNNTFIEKIQQAYYENTGLPQIQNIITGLTTPITTALNNNTNYCQGLDVNIPLEITAWGDTPNKSVTVYLFGACEGLLKNVSDIWLPIVNGAVYISGFLIGINIYLGAFGMRINLRNNTGIDVAP
jgi:hypothetical protein